MRKKKVTFKDLVEILEVDKIAPIHYQSKDELNKENYVFCRYLSNEEKQALISKTHDPNKKYDESDLGVYLPNISIIEYYKLENKRNSDSIKKVIEYIGKNFKFIPSDKIFNSILIQEYELLWALYCILHEVGHWLDFKNSGKSAYEFSIIEKGYREDLEKERRMIYQIPDNHPQKRILMDNFNQKYSEIPSEKEANKYAFDNLEKSLNLVREKLNYTEQELIQNQFIFI